MDITPLNNPNNGDADPSDKGSSDQFDDHADGPSFIQWMAGFLTVAIAAIATGFDCVWWWFYKTDTRAALIAIGLTVVAVALLIRVFWDWIRLLTAVFCGVLTIASVVLWLKFNHGERAPTIIAAAVICSFLAFEALLWSVRGSPPDHDDVLEIEAKWDLPKEPSGRLRSAMVRKKNAQTELDEFVHAELRDHAHVLTWWALFAVSWTCGFVYVVRLRQLPLEPIFGVYIVVMLGLSIKWLFWWKNTNAFTSKRIVQVYGLVGKNYPQATITRINDVQLDIPWHSDVMTWLRWTYTQYGSLQFEIPGNVTLGSVDNIPQIYGVNRRVEAMILGDKDS